MREALRNHAWAGKPIYGECGGLMYLSDAIVDLHDETFSMLGLISGKAVMQSKLQALCYVEVTTRADTPLGAAGTAYLGHRFRYSIFEAGSGSQLELTVKRIQTEGYGGDNVLGTYVYGHWASNPKVATHFVHASTRALARRWPCAWCWLSSQR
jgi:cobyrinic acid a,c-diamide synthase